MKRDFTHENFEDFLKRNADSLRMKAPEKVWQNLSKELNKRRRRFITGLTAFLLITTAAGYFITTNVSEQAGRATETPVRPQQANEGSITSAVQAEKENLINNNPKTSNVKLFSRRLGNQLNQNTSNAPLVDNSLVALYPLIANNLIKNELANTISEQASTLENNFSPTIVDSYSEFDELRTIDKNELNQPTSTQENLPLTIESVVNSFKAKNRKGKVETQVYFTPTISYRKLTENKSYLRSLDPANMPPNFPDLNSSVNNNVTHKPDVGFEVGFTAKYPVSKKLKIRSGLQFNVNRYDIRAFNSSTTIAPIALNNGQTTNVVNTITSYSNESGYKRNWLQNLSFQASAPVGIEYGFGGNDKLQFGVGTTVQPTYIIGDRAYLITMDYKSYTQEPWLIRRWNVNTSLETFVTYNSGKTKWQFGPQVRYQLLSSFISKYPVKENLFDFGLKVGVSFTK